MKRRVGHGKCFNHKAFTIWAVGLWLSGCVTYDFSEEETASAHHMTVKGGLTADEVEPTIEAYDDQIQSCKENIDPKDAQGVVIVEFDIGYGGKVVSAEVLSTTVNSDAIAKCVKSQVRAWQFMEPRGDGHAIVVYPFQFQ